MFAAIAVAALALAAPLFAMGSEEWWGLAPCALCLWQRWPYWAAAALAAAAGLAPSGRARGALLGLSGAAVLASAAIAAVHLGVEQGWWPSPLPGCTAPRGGGGAATVDDLLRGLAPAPAKACDAPSYLVPGLPISLAAMNGLYALGLSALALTLAARGAKR